MFKTIASSIEYDRDYPPRQWTIDVYTRVLDGALYDHLPHPFHLEESKAGEYVKLRDRRPSVTYGLCRIVVDNSASLLFSEGHFPTPQSPDKAVADGLAAVIKHCHLNEVMLEATQTGSVGSVVIMLRALRQKDGTHRLFPCVMNTMFLTPTFDLAAPDTLTNLREKYKVRGSVLRDLGYVIDDKKVNQEFWFARDWNEREEVWYQPWPLTQSDGPKDSTPAFTRDDSRTVMHNLGFVPAVWIRNLPGKLRLASPDLGIPSTAQCYSDIDGACTFAAAINSAIEIDYQLSQAGRGLKYSMDPLLLIKEPVQPDEKVYRSASQAIVTGEKGDAKLVEIEGTAFQVVLEYVSALRQYALEATHGNRSDPDKMATAQSGRAMELLNQCLIWLADRLKVSYGEGALLVLLRMVLKINARYPIACCGKLIGELAPDADISLQWANWHQPTYSDRLENASALKVHTDAGHLSRQTATRIIASDFDIADPDAEVAQANSERETDKQAETDSAIAIAKAKPALRAAG